MDAVGAGVEVTLYVLTGLPGSGKSTLARDLVAATGAAHVSMDDAMVARGVSIVDFEARFALQPEVEATIAPLLESGRSVVAEFGSWSRAERDRLRHLADGARARPELHWLDTSVDVCRERLLARAGASTTSDPLAADASQAGADLVLATDVLGAASDYEAPTAEEGAQYDAFIATATR